MATNPAVSIIVPCYLTTPHQVELLRETLRTVTEQIFRDFETILVDDGSPIEAAPVAAEFPGTRCIRRENGGSALARNTGIGASKGRCLVFLDADDHLLPPALEAGIAALDQHPECGFAVGRRQEMTYEGAPQPWGVAALPSEVNIYKTLLGFDWYIIPPSSAIFRREVVESVGGFQNPWGCDDLDFYLRVARRHQVFCFEEPPVTRYRRYSASSSRDGERMLRSVREVYHRQLPYVQGDPELQRAYTKGLTTLTEIFRDCLAENLRDRCSQRQWSRAIRAARLLLAESPGRFVAEVARLFTREPASLPARA